MISFLNCVVPFLGMKWFPLLLVLIVLSACAQDVVRVPVVERLVEQEVQIDPFVRAVMDQASAVPNVEYRLSLLPQLNIGSFVQVGDRAKLEPVAGIVLPEYSVIFIDYAKKQALGMCVAGMRIHCKEPGKGTTVNFSDVAEPTPYDWLKKVPASAEVIGTASFDLAEATIIQYVDGNQLVKLWVHDFYKLPLQVEVTEGEIVTTYVYDIAYAGKLKESEVLPP